MGVECFFLVDQAQAFFFPFHIVSPLLSSYFNSVREEVLIQIIGFCGCAWIEWYCSRAPSVNSIHDDGLCAVVLSFGTDLSLCFHSFFCSVHWSNMMYLTRPLRSIQFNSIQCSIRSLPAIVPAELHEVQ